MSNEKRLLPLLYFLFLAFQSCAPTVKQIGNLNMVSQRNVDSKMGDYAMLNSYAGASQRELKKTRAENIEEAIDQVVRKVPGGEFLKNVKIYVVRGKYYAVEGDVWGYEENNSYRGFSVGTKVQWKGKGKKYVQGVVTGLKDDKVCLVREEGEEQSVEKKYDDLTKIEE